MQIGSKLKAVLMRAIVKMAVRAVIPIGVHLDGRSLFSSPQAHAFLASALKRGIGGEGQVPASSANEPVAGRPGVHGPELPVRNAVGAANLLAICRSHPLHRHRSPDISELDQRSSAAYSDVHCLSQTIADPAPTHANPAKNNMGFRSCHTNVYKLPAGFRISPAPTEPRGCPDPRPALVGGIRSKAAGGFL